MSKKSVVALIVAAGFVLTVRPGIAAIDVKMNFDKTFDFTKAHTWGWSVGVGDVVAGRTPKDDPQEIRQARRAHHRARGGGAVAGPRPEGGD